MLRCSFALLAACAFAQAQPPVVEEKKASHGRPAQLEIKDLADIESLPEDRKKLIAGALAVANDSPWLPYLFGGSDPKAGGFDCSGAMYYVMRKAGLAPPRTSADQYFWLKENDRLVEVPATAKDLDAPELKKLKPGDLLFWGGTYKPTAGHKVNITHVALYLPSIWERKRRMAARS